ncbi:MAG: hypothetical protein ACWA5P_00105 [bacterium]
MAILFEYKRFLGFLLVSLLLLVIPLIANYLSSSFNWTTSDFLIAGIILISLSIGIEVILRFIKKKEHKPLLIFLLIAVFVLLFMELAVGIFGTPLAGN